MLLIGNLLLGIATLFLLLFAVEFFGKTAPGGDAAVSFSWGVLIFHLAIFVCCALAAAVVGWRGGFAWIGSSGGGRFLLVAAGLVLAIMGSMFASFREGSAVLARVGGVLPFVILGFLIAGLAILLNGGTAFRLPIFIATGLGTAACGLIFLSFLKLENENAARAVEDSRRREDEHHRRRLAEIDSCDVTKNMVFLFVRTDANQDADVRQRAVEKIKTHPDWQGEIIRLLTCDWAPKAFNFLASNAVDTPARFAEPLRVGIEIQAKLIRKTIRSSRGGYDFYPDQFSWEVERVLRTVEKFENSGVDYRPAVEEMRRALDEPSEFEKPDYRCRALLDRWLKKR